MVTSPQAYIFLHLVSPQPRKPFPEEKNFRTLANDGTVTKPAPLPCWQDTWATRKPTNQKSPPFLEPAELFMSVVVPAYNEENRLEGMLEEAVDYLERTYGALAKNDAGLEETKSAVRQRKANGKTNGHQLGSNSSNGWEILIVSDGSTDKTEETAFAFAHDHQLSVKPKRHVGPWTPDSRQGVHIPPGSIRVVSLTKNRGKGGAVTHGMRHVRGQYIVFADADGASKFDDLGKLVSECQSIEDAKGRGVAVGSRAHMVGSEAVVQVGALPFFFFWISL